MNKFKIGDKVNFVLERSLLSGVITKFYKNTHNEEECSIKTEIKTFPHILLRRVSKINDEDDLIKKIADLEAELAKSKQEANNWKQKFESSEERNKQMTDNGVKALELKNEKIKELKQQLAEKEKEICEKIYKLFTNEIMWLTMKDWWLNNGQCRNLKEVLNAVEQGFSNQEIVENFSKDREYYHLLKKFKGENK